MRGPTALPAPAQDTWFHHRVDDHNAIFGVLDGHGGENGTLVAEVAAEAIKAHLVEHFNALRTSPEAVCIDAFGKAHEAARRAVLAAHPHLREVDGVLIDEWEDDEGIPRLEAADGGTTATVIALVDGATLIHAQVGDSTALLGGSHADGDVDFVELMEEHSATNPGEYERVLGSGARGKLLRFVYDVPGLTDEGKAPPIFQKKRGPDGYDLDIKSRRTAEVYGTPAKNARGDLPAIIITPDDDDKFGQLEPQSLAMTRSIGDFYMQSFGVVWRPEVISVDLEEVGAKLEHLTLILASDGVWDLWEYDMVFPSITLPPEPRHNLQSFDAAASFFQRSVQRGSEMFDDTADNMTGV